MKIDWEEIHLELDFAWLPFQFLPNSIPHITCPQENNLKIVLLFSNKKTITTLLHLNFSTLTLSWSLYFPLTVYDFVRVTICLFSFI